MSEVLDNIAQGLWKIKRLKKLLEVFGEREVRPGVIVISDERETAKTNRNELKNIRNQVLDQMNQSLDLLSTIPNSCGWRLS